MQVINIVSEPKGDFYKFLLDFGSQYCNKLLLVIIPTINTNKNCKNFLKKLKKNLIKKEKKSEWSGTRLTTKKAKIYKWHLNNETIEIIKNQVNGLYKWQQPDLPEDLSLLRNDNTPFLISLAHEPDSYLELYDNEFSALKKIPDEFKKYFDFNVVSQQRGL